MHHVTVCLVPFCVAVLCYVNSLRGDLVHDDIPAIVKNADLRPQSSLWELWTHDYWGKSMWSKDSHKSYRPLTVLTFRLNYMLSGVDPVPYHILNVLLHALVSGLFAYTSYTTVFNDDKSKALLAGVMFAVHPIHTEAVSSVVGRAELLSATFFLLAFVAYTRSLTSDQSRSLLSICVLCAVLAMLCKEQGITVLGVCGLHSYCQHCHKTTKFPNTTTAFLGLCTSLILSIRVAWLQGTLPVFQREDNPLSYEDNIIVRCLSQLHVYCITCWLLLCPHTLSHDWQFGSIPLVESTCDIRNIASVVMVAGVVMSVGKACHKTKGAEVVCMGLLFTIIPFIPAANLLFRVGFVIAERTLYIPSMGLIILAIHGMGQINQIVGEKRHLVVVGLFLLSHSCRTISRNRDWASRESLAGSGLKTLPHNAKMQFNYGNVLRDKGFLSEALIHYKEAVRLWPDYANAHNNLATLLLTQNTTESKYHFMEAIRACPSHANAHFNLAIQLWLEEKFDKAVMYLHKTLIIDPQCKQCHLKMAALLCHIGNRAQAMFHINTALKIGEDRETIAKQYVSCVNTLENLKSPKQNVRSAEYELPINDNIHLSYVHYETSNETEANNSTQWTDMKHENFHQIILESGPSEIIETATHLAKHGMRTKAIILLEHVVNDVKETSTKAQVYFVLGECYKDNGNLNNAIFAFQKTVLLLQNHAAAHHNLAVAYHVLKNVQQAQYHYHAALQLDPTNGLLLQNYRKFEEGVKHH